MFLNPLALTMFCNLGMAVRTALSPGSWLWVNKTCPTRFLPLWVNTQNQHKISCVRFQGGATEHKL
jgi:hypothetical protein